MQEHMNERSMVTIVTEDSFPRFSLEPVKRDYWVERKYRKHARLVMFEGARGPEWLRKLVMWSAKKLGMLGHDRSISEVPCSRFHKINGADIGDQIRNAVIEIVNSSGLTPDRLEVVCGPEQLGDLHFKMTREVSVFAPVDFARAEKGYNEELGREIERVVRWHGLDVRVVPRLKGFAVLEKAPRR